MDIKELKEAVETNSTKSFMVWSLTDDNSMIIAEQYYRRIASDLGLEVKIIDGYDEIKGDALFEDISLYVMILREDADIREADNLIVICMPGVTPGCDSVVIPKLELWQVEDLLFSSLPGVKKQCVKDLTSKYKTSLYGLLNASQSISEFDVDDQQKAYELLNSEGQFGDRTLDIFELMDCLIKRDTKGVAACFEKYDVTEDDGMRLLNLAKLKFRQVVELQTNRRVTLESSGCKSEKQMWYMKNNVCNYYTNEELYRIYSKLCGVEYFWRSCGLELKDMVNYIVFNILEGFDDAGKLF